MTGLCRLWRWDSNKGGHRSLHYGTVSAMMGLWWENGDRNPDFGGSVAGQEEWSRMVTSRPRIDKWAGARRKIVVMGRRKGRNEGTGVKFKHWKDPSETRSWGARARPGKDVSTRWESRRQCIGEAGLHPRGNAGPLQGLNRWMTWSALHFGNQLAGVRRSWKGQSWSKKVVG